MLYISWIPDTLNALQAEQHVLHPVLVAVKYISLDHSLCLENLKKKVFQEEKVQWSFLKYFTRKVQPILYSLCHYKAFWGFLGVSSCDSESSYTCPWDTALLSNFLVPLLTFLGFCDIFCFLTDVRKNLMCSPLSFLIS